MDNANHIGHFSDSRRRRLIYLSLETWSLSLIMCQEGDRGDRMLQILRIHNAHNAPQRQGVVRTDLEVGVPSYTLQPSNGELSLGIGRKRSVEEEYELAETMTNLRKRIRRERLTTLAPKTLLRTFNPPYHLIFRLPHLLL